MPEPTRILVADDSETILLLMRRRLELEGYEVITAIDGETAMEDARRTGREAPDVIMLDAMMPGVSGLDVLRTLRGEGLGTPVLIISAHPQVREMFDAPDLEVSDYIAKPIDFDELLALIPILTAE